MDAKLYLTMAWVVDYMNQQGADILGKYALGMEQFFVLVLLYEKGALGAKMIQNKMGLSVGGGAVDMDPLLEEGYIEAVADAGDVFHPTYRITSLGQALVEDVYPRYKEVVVNCLETWDEAEREVLQGLLGGFKKAKLKARLIDKVDGLSVVAGDGVKLTRVLSNVTAENLNPFLLLDSFDSKNYSDYLKGFPMHGHRGIETITYIHKGGIIHEDSLGNQRRISDGQVQWICTGSGVFHSETFQKEKHLQGVQLWLNLPSAYKMVEPTYIERTGEVVEEDFGKRRIISSKENSASIYTPVDLQVLEIHKGSVALANKDFGDRGFLFTIQGEVLIEGDQLDEKTAGILSEGEKVEIRALSDAVVLFAAAPTLDEPMAWGVSIVMNTEEELLRAFKELRNKNFIKETRY